MVLSNFGRDINTNVNLDKLYDMIKSKRYLELMPPNFFPEIEIADDVLYMKSSNFVKEDSFSPTMQQFFYVFDKNGVNSKEVTPGFIAIYPYDSLLKVSGNSKSPETLDIIGAYSLQCDLYTPIHSKLGSKTTVVDEEDDTIEDEPKTFYVPKNDSADAIVRSNMNRMLTQMQRKHQNSLRSTLGLL